MEAQAGMCVKSEGRWEESRRQKEQENMRREELEGWKGVLIFWPCLEVTLHDTCRGLLVLMLLLVCWLFAKSCKQ